VDMTKGERRPAQMRPDLYEPLRLERRPDGGAIAQRPWKANEDSMIFTYCKYRRVYPQPCTPVRYIDRALVPVLYCTIYAGWPYPLV